MAVNELEGLMKRFLVERLGADSIDDIPLKGASARAKKADYFHSDRHIVIEVKSLVDDRTDVVKKVLTRFRKQKDWPRTGGDLTLKEFLRAHPRRSEVNADLSSAVTASIRNACEDANEQVRSTVQVFGLGDVMGIVVILNQAIDIFSPKLCGLAVHRVLHAKRGDGTRRLAHLDSAIVVSRAHLIRTAEGQVYEPLVTVAADRIMPEDRESIFETHFAREWAAYLGRPYRDGGLVKDTAEFDDLDITGRKPPTIFDGNPIDQ
jgi:hypothetical protein